MKNPYTVVRDFEAAVCEYTGAPYCVAVNSCTSALLLAVAWQFWKDIPPEHAPILGVRSVEIPKRTYVSVPMSIIHAGGRPTFRDEEWRGFYQLKPLGVFDCARRFTSGMSRNMGVHADVVPIFQCVSFHATKILADTQGGAILHDSAEADAWLRRARFDGRTEGVEPKDDTFTQIGYHCYMSPDVAARLLLKMHSLPRHNEDLPNDDYPDLSQMEIFK